MQRILFFVSGSFSGINDAVLAGLRREFPTAEIRVVDIHALLKARRLLMAANLVAACAQYGGDLLTRRRDLDDAFFGTTYLFGQVRRLAHEVHREWPADCSFQTQSMFDCSFPGVRHFVYTDHTFRNCPEYPDYGRAQWAPLRRDAAIALEQQIYRNAAVVFTMSRNVERRLVGADGYGLPARKVQCVRVGCNADQTALASIADSSQRYDRKRILFLGREWDRKGGPQLVEAFRQVRTFVPDATLVIAGAAPEISEPNVEVLGPVSLTQVVELLASASVFCMPSRFEAFGIVFVEAMAAGLPVVACRLGAAIDFVIDGTTGLLARPGDARDVERCLLTLLADPASCRRIGAQARAFATSHYSWDRTCAEMASRMVTEGDRRAAQPAGPSDTAAAVSVSG